MKKALLFGIFLLILASGLQNAYADNSAESQARRAQRDADAANQGGVRTAGGMPTDAGLQHPMTFLGGGRYRDANGTYVKMTGPDGQERWEYENPEDKMNYEASQDAEWQKHKGKFPGTYWEWRDLQQYKDADDLWGDPGTAYDHLKRLPDSSSIQSGMQDGQAMNSNMEMMESH